MSQQTGKILVTVFVIIKSIRNLTGDFPNLFVR